MSLLVSVGGVFDDGAQKFRAPSVTGVLIYAYDNRAIRRVKESNRLGTVFHFVRTAYTEKIIIVPNRPKKSRKT